jgi:ABC-type transporter Mla subunit MlaD
MRRLALLLAIIAASVGALLTTSASGGDTHTYYIELDNAFGLVNGSEVKVAGVSAGKITDLFINSSKRAVAKVELSGPVAVLGQDSICSSEPQSLIAEYFIDCTPKGPPIQTTDGSDDDHAENPDIPVEQTRQTVQNDLVLSTMRLPFRERLTLLINEFGTALAGNAENLNTAIRRGAPALEQTRQVFDLLAKQNTIIRDLNANSDEIIGKLAARRQDVVDFINETKNTAEISASRRDDLSQNFALLDDFLAELKPTMTELNGLAVQGTPLAANLRRAAPGLTTLSRNLPNFNPAATDALVSLGKSAVVGQRALTKGRDEVRALRNAAKKSYPVANDLADFLRDIDDPRRAVETDARAAVDTGRKAPTGYTGMEGLLNYVYYQTLAINQYDEIGHLLHFSIFEVGTGPCASYNAGVYKGATGVPDLSGDGTTTDVTQAHRCVAWLGRNQPGLSQPVNVPPYNASVCPGGSDDTAVCDPAGTLSAAADFSRGKKRSSAAADAPGSSAPGSSPGTAPSGTDGTGSTPVVPPTTTTPTTPTVPTAPGQGTDPGGLGGLGILGLRSNHSQGSANANGDLLGYLFGN